MRCHICTRPLGVWNVLLGRRTHAKCLQRVEDDWSSLRDVAYFEWCCISDEHSCDACKEAGRLHWLPGYPKAPKEPLPSCSSKEGCRCAKIAIMADSGTVTHDDGQGEVTVHRPGDALDVAGFLKRSGGAATDDQVKAYTDAQLAPQRKRQGRENMAAGKIGQASQMEKDQPDRAVVLYKEGIELWKQSLAEGADAYAWGHLDRAYNRMTLTLERAGRLDEALAQIASYTALAGDRNSSEMLRLQKRAARVRRKMSSPTH